MKSAIDLPVLIELKNGETFNGKLANIDLWMNVSMKEVVRTSKDASEFWSMPEVYVRGNTIKYVRVPDEVLDVVAEEKQAREAAVSWFFSSFRGQATFILNIRKIILTLLIPYNVANVEKSWTRRTFKVQRSWRGWGR